MIDLSKYPCPLCKNKTRNNAEHEMAYCGSCALGIEGPDGSEQSAADAFIALSEAVHGKQHDGETVDVRIAVVLGQHGEWNAAKSMSHDGAEEFNEMSKWIYGMRGHHIITATLPVPVAQEVKGRVEG